MTTTALRQGSSLTAEHGEAKLPTIDASAPRAVEVGEVTTLFLGLGFEGLGLGDLLQGILMSRFAPTENR